MNFEILNNFLKIESRNKVIIHNKLFNNVKYLDIGLCLSEFLVDKLTDKNIGMISKEFIDNLISEYCFVHPTFGKIIALKNIGILLEENLKLNFVNFLELHSKSLPLFIEWKGEYNNKKLYFLKLSSGLKFDISQINHLFISSERS